MNIRNTGIHFVVSVVQSTLRHPCFYMYAYPRELYSTVTELYVECCVISNEEAIINCCYMDTSVLKNMDKHSCMLYAIQFLAQLLMQISTTNT